MEATYSGTKSNSSVAAKEQTPRTAPISSTTIKKQRTNLRTIATIKTNKTVKAIAIG